MRFQKSLVHIYLILWAFYWLQGILFPSGGIVSRLLLTILMVVSIYCFFYANVKYNLPKMLKTLSVLIGIFTLYGFIAIIFGRTFTIAESGHSGISAYIYLKKIYISLLPIYAIFIASKKNNLNEKSMRIWTFVFLAVAILGFYRYQNEALFMLEMYGIERSEVTNNGAYVFLAVVCMLPLFYEKPLLQYIILAICMYYVLIGMKRGALLCGIVASLWFIYNSVLTKSYTRRRFITVILAVILVMLTLYMVNFLLENSDYFNRRLERTLMGESSHRNEIYTILLNHFLSESNPLRFLFGNGANATLNITYNYAHNDWLEIAINNGFLMIIVYSIYWIRMYKTIHLSKNNKVCYLMISLFFIVYFLKTLFSMSYSDVPICASTALGYALSNYDGKNED